jgi:uncharacterized protein YndB with AHSA1/START domain
MATNVSTVTIKAPAQRIWEALTKPELVKQWQYGADLLTDWQVGNPIVFRNEWEGNVFEQKGTVLEVVPEKLVKYTLFFPHPGMEDKPENYFTMAYALEETDGTTVLTVTQQDSRPQQPAAQTDENEHSVLDDLKKLIEG